MKQHLHRSLRTVRAWAQLFRWLRITLSVVGALSLVKIGVQIYLQLRTHVTPPWAGRLLDNPIRWLYRNPGRTIRPLQLTAGLRVLEVGAGIGAFTIPLAEQVGAEGMVYSVELQSAMLTRQRDRVRKNNCANVYLHQADALHLPFATASFDRAILIALLPMLPEKQRGLRELRRVLKPGALLAVSEELPEPEYVPLAVTRRWCVEAGFEELSVDRAALFYTLVCRNPSQDS